MAERKREIDWEITQNEKQNEMENFNNDSTAISIETSRCKEKWIYEIFNYLVIEIV